MEARLIGVTTRFHLRSAWQMIPMYLAYRQMHRDLARARGLLRFAFLVESPVACCTFSIWESEQALVAFSNVPNHIRAVRRAKVLCREIWSAYWSLDTISKSAQGWSGERPWPAGTVATPERTRFARKALLMEEARREEAPRLCQPL